MSLFFNIIIFFKFFKASIHIQQQIKECFQTRLNQKKFCNNLNSKGFLGGIFWIIYLIYFYRQQIQEALNKQTYHQFLAYAQQTHPGEPEKVCWNKFFSNFFEIKVFFLPFWKLWSLITFRFWGFRAKKIGNFTSHNHVLSLHFSKKNFF